MRAASVLPATLAAALLAVTFGPAAAESYPARPITLVVPFAPGGSASTVARSVADKMSETLGQQIVIDNRGGAGGTLATRTVALCDPKHATTHVALAGVLALAAAEVAEVETRWRAQVDDPELVRWQRDRPLLQVAMAARAARRERAWQLLG